MQSIIEGLDGRIHDHQLKIEYTYVGIFNKNM
jgi:hypothetical protein